MYKLKKRPLKQEKPPNLYNILENYTDHDPPGNVMVCATTGPENLPIHAKVLSESYDIPLEDMAQLLEKGGVYTYPQTGLLVTRGVFVCKIDQTGHDPKHTWVLDVEQYAQAEHVRTSRGVTMPQAAEQVFYRGLPQELQDRLKQKNLGLEYSKIDPSISRGGDITYIDFRKDWSPHFKRHCVMPDGKLVETSGLQDFAALHEITQQEAKGLLDHGGTVELKDQEVLACQVINGQPTVARFNAHQFAKAKELVETKGLHIMDALSEIALNDPILMRALRRAEAG